MRSSVRLLLVLYAAVALGAEGPPPKRMEIRFAEARWQAMPPEIRQVFVGPDGRVWYECLRRTARPPALEAIQRLLADEFTRASPQVNHVRLALFEPGGRIWFYAPSARTLLAYDGKGWITHAVSGRYDEPRARCLTRGGLIDADAHRFVGGAAWFLGARGVYRFDGAAWSYQQMLDKAPSHSQDLCLSVSPDGSLAVACPRRTQSLWVFRQGRWSEHKVIPDGGSRYVSHLVAADSQTVWCVLSPGQLRRWTIGPEGRVVLRPDAEGSEWTAFGSVRAAKIRAMYQDQTGRIFLAADSLDDGRWPPRGGVAILKPDGQTRVLRSEGLEGAWRPGYSGLAPPILTESGEQVWLPNRNTGEPAALFDFSRQEFVDSVPHPAFACLHAVAGGARLFVARGNLGSDGQTIMLYTPGAAEPPGLAVRRIEIGNGPVAAGDDGDVWAEDPFGRLICFTDGQWKTVRAESEPRVRAVLPGRGGVTLVDVGQSLLVYQGLKEIAAGGAIEVLEEHRDLVCRAFGPERRPASTPTPLMLTASRDGRLWCLRDHALRLLVGNRWHDALDPLVVAGARNEAVEYIAPVGDGGMVFVSDLAMRHDRGRSFLGQLSQGKLAFTDAPHVLRYGGWDCLAIRDSEGGLWIPGTKGAARPTGDFFSGQIAVRLQERGVVQQLENSGWAMLADEAGSVWLGGVWGGSPDLVNIWRGGKIVQRLRIPGYGGGFLFSDRPGSVYALTVLGLQHLTSDPPDFREYRLGRVFSIRGIIGSPIFKAFSKPNRLVVATFADTPARKRFLHLVDLPAPTTADR